MEEKICNHHNNLYPKNKKQVEKYTIYYYNKKLIKKQIKIHNLLKLYYIETYKTYKPYNHFLYKYFYCN